MYNKKRSNFFKMFFSGFFRANDLFAIYKDEELEDIVKKATENRLSWYKLSRPHIPTLLNNLEKKDIEKILENYKSNDKDYSSRIASYWNSTGSYIYNAMNTFDEKNGVNK